MNVMVDPETKGKLQKIFFFSPDTHVSCRECGPKNHRHQQNGAILLRFAGNNFPSFRVISPQRHVLPLVFLFYPCVSHLGPVPNVGWLFGGRILR